MSIALVIESRGKKKKQQKKPHHPRTFSTLQCVNYMLPVHLKTNGPVARLSIVVVLHSFVAIKSIRATVVPIACASIFRNADARYIAGHATAFGLPRIIFTLG